MRHEGDASRPITMSSQLPSWKSTLAMAHDECTPTSKLGKNNRQEMKRSALFPPNVRAEFGVTRVRHNHCRLIKISRPFRRSRMSGYSTSDCQGCGVWNQDHHKDVQICFAPKLSHSVVKMAIDLMTCYNACWPEAWEIGVDSRRNRCPNSSNEDSFIGERTIESQASGR